MARAPEPDVASPDFRIPTTRASAVAAELRRLIQNGSLQPGDRLRQAEIARRFGTSTTPIREAFTALAREGLVQQDAHRGAVVFRPQRLDLVENYEIRGALEPLATELAALRITDEELAAVEAILVRMRAESDTTRYQDLNRDFHATIYRAAARPRLAAMIENLRDASESYLRLNAARPDIGDYQQQVHAEHEAIGRALHDHDGDRARQVMVEHLRHNRRQLEDLVERLAHTEPARPPD